MLGHVVSASVSILKFPQHPFGDPPQIPPLPCGGICGGFESAGRGEEAVLVVRTVGSEDNFDEGEIGPPMEERTVDVRTVEIVRSIDELRADDTP